MAGDVHSGGRPRPAKSTTERGYGHTHQQRRKWWAPRVAAGRIRCWRCGHRIIPGTPWDLGHDDDDRRRYRGPEHRACNRRAGARKGNRLRRKPRRPNRSRLEW